MRYYNDLINGLISEGIAPVVTLYHWDLPQPLQDLGGWPNKEIAVYFEDYARVAFALFGDRVKTWITVNEPPEICSSSYGLGIDAPAIHSPGIGEYLCGKTVLLAHAKAYRLYDTVFRTKQQGKSARKRIYECHFTLPVTIPIPIPSFHFLALHNKLE